MRADGERAVHVGDIVGTLPLVLLLEPGERLADAIVDHGADLTGCVTRPSPTA